MKVVAVLFVLGLVACGADAGNATARVSAWGEDFIEEGIPAEEVADGWTVTFESFNVEVEQIDVEGASVAGPFVVDLVEPSAGVGQELGHVDVPAGQTLRVSWSLNSIATRGRATRGDASKTFDWSFEPQVRYVECDTEVLLVDGESADAVLTVHADHLFYDDLDDENPNVVFDLIAQSDADDDGEVTLAELEQQSILNEVRYQVGGRDISDLRAFIAAQARTVGHINGEGHCDIE